MSTWPISSLSHCFWDLSCFHPFSYQELLAHPIPGHQCHICRQHCPACPASSHFYGLCHGGADLTAQILSYLPFVFLLKYSLQFCIHKKWNWEWNNEKSNCDDSGNHMMNSKSCFCHTLYMCVWVPLQPRDTEKQIKKQIKKNPASCEFYLYWRFPNVERASSRPWFKWFEICPPDPARERISTLCDF